MKITHRKIQASKQIKVSYDPQKLHSSTDVDNESFVVDYDLNKMSDEWWKKEEEKRIARELADEADDYDLNHVEGSKDLPRNQWIEEYDDEVGDYLWTYSNENGTAIIRPDGKDYKTPGDVGYDLLVKYAFNGDRPRMMREHYEGGGALDSAMLSGEMSLFDFNPVESCDQVTASSDWVEGFTEGVGQYFDLEREAGTAQIYEMEADGDIGYGVLVKYNDKKKKDADTFWGPNALNDAKEFAEYCLEDEIESCDNVTAASSTSFSTDVTASNIVPNRKIQEGMVFYTDGFAEKVTSVAPDRKTCKVTEDWIAEDTGEPQHREYTYNIVEDEGGEYMYDPEYAKYAKVGSDDYSWWARKYASGANNYPWREDPEFSDLFSNGTEEEEDYTPSATAGDYSPSNPWDAPGMSVKDFI